jgi:predicted nucleic acid-binding protein
MTVKAEEIAGFQVTGIMTTVKGVVGKESAEIYGKIRAELEKKGTPLTEPDMRTASIALCHKLVLVTGNEKHFSRISGLTIDNWLKT